MIDTENIVSQAKEALDNSDPEKALAMLKIPEIENRPEVLFLKAEIYFKLQRWGEALNHFSRFLEHSPSDKKAESYCLMIQNILGFYNKDLFNP